MIRRLVLPIFLLALLLPALPGLAAPVKPAEVIALAERVADHQLATLAAGEFPPFLADHSADPKGWVQGALFAGLAALAERSARPHYAAAIQARGRANGWRPGQQLYYADDHAIGRAYLWAFRHGAGPAAMEPLRQAFDRILAAPSSENLAFLVRDGRIPCQDRWCWSDAIFMSPPVWLELAALTGDPRYRDFAMREFRAATDYLFDATERLYFRDSRFFDMRDAAGRKIFWSRGNGWAFSGIASMIALLPADHPERARLVAHFAGMAERLAGLQTPRGFWPPSLLGEAAEAPPETSGTGFFVHGIAWGIRAGLLDRSRYEPVVRRGWAALAGSVDAAGKLGWVQQIADRPDLIEKEQTHLYGVGAFLLAAGAVADLGLE